MVFDHRLSQLLGCRCQDIVGRNNLNGHTKNQEKNHHPKNGPHAESSMHLSCFLTQCCHLFHPPFRSDNPQPVYAFHFFPQRKDIISHRNMHMHAVMEPAFPARAFPPCKKDFRSRNAIRSGLRKSFICSVISASISSSASVQCKGRKLQMPPADKGEIQ